jgi:Fis family transcriptional regulator
MNNDLPEQTKAKAINQGTLAQCATQALERYFRELDGFHTADLYQMVMAEVERPLLLATLNYVNGNQSRAATMLGISRSTLRKKLAQYNLG